MEHHGVQPHKVGLNCFPEVSETGARFFIVVTIQVQPEIFKILLFTMRMRRFFYLSGSWAHRDWPEKTADKY